MTSKRQVFFRKLSTSHDPDGLVPVAPISGMHKARLLPLLLPEFHLLLLLVSKEYRQYAYCKFYTAHILPDIARSSYSAAGNRFLEIMQEPS